MRYRDRKDRRRAGGGAKKHVPVALLVICDLLLIAVGVGAFYLYLAVLPQPYEVVVAPTLRPHPRVAQVAVSTRPTTQTRPAATGTTTEQPATATVAPTVGLATTAKVASVAGVSPESPSVTLAPTGTATPPPIATSTVRPSATPRPMKAQTAAPPTSPPAPVAPLPAPGGALELGGGKFADKFTGGDVQQSATSYRSSDINVTLTKVQRKGVTYYVQDIYVRYVDNLRSAFARNTYGRLISAWDLDIANQNHAIGAINGDWYGTGTIGTVIRNGVLYSARVDGDVCVLFSDGTMKVYAPNEFDAKQAMAQGAWQAWSFGPGLMTPEGKAIGVFNSGIAGLNPRTAIGYFEPGHYAFVVVDGRQPGYSNGMTLAQLAALFQELGCKVAYNLDGGQTSEMVFGGQVVNHPYRGGRPVSDIIYVGE